MFTTNAQFNGLSSASYRNKILQSQLKILSLVYFALTWFIFAGLVTYIHTYKVARHSHVMFIKFLHKEIPMQCVVPITRLLRYGFNCTQCDLHVQLLQDKPLK